MCPGERLSDWRLMQTDINSAIEFAPAEIQGLITFLKTLASRIDERYLASQLISCPLLPGESFDHPFDAAATTPINNLCYRFSER